MKKSMWRWSLAAMLGTALFLAGCGKQEPVPEPEPDPITDPDTPDPTPPGEVGNLTAVASCTADGLVVQLGWEAVEAAETYALERDYVALEGGLEGLGFVDADVEAGEKYTYVLTALNDAGESRGEPVTVDIAYDTCSFSGVRMKAGMYGTILISAGGEVWSWGDNSHGSLGTGLMDEFQPPMAVPYISDAVAVSNFGEHSLVLDAAGQVWSFGRNRYGQLGVTFLVEQRSMPAVVAGLPEIKAIAAGSQHSLAVDVDGHVWAWGRNSAGELGLGAEYARVSVPTQVDGLEDVTAVFAGYSTSYALHADGTVSAWGANGEGQLGIGTDTSQPVPLPVTGLADIVWLEADRDVALALDADGNVWGMGDNPLIIGRDAHELVPVKLDGLSGIASLSMSATHVLALQDDGTAIGWGYGYYGGLGAGAVTPGPVTTPVTVEGAEGAVAMSAGNLFSVAVTADGSVLAWGVNYEGQLGESGEQVTFGFRPVELPGPVTKVAAHLHNLALLDDGSVWAWGLGYSGQLGDGFDSPSGTPVQVQFPDGVVITDVAAGMWFSLALDDTGSIWSWGDNHAGGLGDGSIGRRLLPAKIPLSTAFSSIAAHEYSAMAIDTAGNVWVWGSNFNGELGLSGVVQTGIPTMTGITDALMLAPGLSHSAVLLNDGSVVSMGTDGYGELGNGMPRESSASPVSTMALPNLSGLVAADQFSLAWHGNGDMSVWGNNTGGMLAHPIYAPAFASEPLDLPAVSDVELVAAQGRAVLALRSDGGVYGWGDAGFGQFGLELGGPLYGPMELDVPGSGAATSVALGVNHGVLVVDGEVYTSGMDNRGQLGQGKEFVRSVPAPVPDLPVAAPPG